MRAQLLRERGQPRAPLEGRVPPDLPCFLNQKAGGSEGVLPNEAWGGCPNRGSEVQPHDGAGRW